MKFIHIICLAFALSIGSIHNISAQIQSTPSYFLHTITKGQSLYSISRMYNVSVQEIVSMNPGSDKQICTGDSLRIPQSVKPGDGRPSFHTIQVGETLYQLSQKYNIAVPAICDANPGLSAKNFKIGQVIAIPAQTADNAARKEMEKPQETVTKNEWKDMHKVQRRETIYSISREYGITEEELIAANPELKHNKLKRGKFLFIPYSKAELTKEKEEKKKQVAIPTNEELFDQNREVIKNIKSIKAALMLPFMTEQASKKDEQLRMIEYYEGFLIAMDSLKRQGVSVELFTYDTGGNENTVKSILAKKEMEDMNIIFGPALQKNVEVVADFAKKHDIRLVVPFSPKVDQVFNCPNIYQINTPQSYLYSEVYDHFVRKFSNYNIIFVKADRADADKAEFISGLKNECMMKKIDYKEINLDVTGSPEGIMAKMDTLGNNIFIPTSGKTTSLIKMLPRLTQIRREHPGFDMHLFGYPEWQTYTQDYLSDFYELDTYFYSSFYTNNLFPEAIKFTHDFRKWYSKDMANIFPKYGMLGFDTGYFFLKGLAINGSSMEENINKCHVTPIQTGFKFERVNNWGGFINRKVFFVHFTKNYELIKLNFE